jgi:hypothetical protein
VRTLAKIDVSEVPVPFFNGKASILDETSRRIGSSWGRACFSVKPLVLGDDPMRRLSVAAIVLAIVAMAGLAMAAENPTGSWKWTGQGGGGKKGGGGTPRETTLKLKLEGDKLTGTVSMPGRGGAAGTDTAIEDGKYKDGELSFSVSRERNGQKMTTKYTGKVSGDTIKGKIEGPGRGGEVTTRDWEAKRAAQ